MADNARGVAAVLCAVGGIDLVIDIRVGLHESDIFVDAAGLDATFMPRLSAAEPGSGAPIHGADVKVVTMTDDLYRHRVS